VLTLKRRVGGIPKGTEDTPQQESPSIQAQLPTRRTSMLHYAVVFFIIALIAALFGFGGIAASAAGIAKILFIVFAIMAVASFLFGVLKKGT
jgi:uncharacterized membrane protein YtjA (UPF0391 family)